MAGAQDYAQWIVEHPNLKGTAEFDTVAKAYKEAKAMETLQSGGEEYANESILYEKPQVGVGRKLVQSAGKGIVGALDTLIGAPEAVYRLGQYATSKDMPLPPYPAPLQTKLVESGVFTPEAEFNTPIGKVADFTTQLYTGGGFNPAKSARFIKASAIRSCSGVTPCKPLLTMSDGVLRIPKGVPAAIVVPPVIANWANGLSTPRLLRPSEVAPPVTP